MEPCKKRLVLIIVLLLIIKILILKRNNALSDCKLAKEYDAKSENDQLKYILMWTSCKTMPFYYLKQGQNAFVEANCDYKNCYVTNCRNFLVDITMYDAILFHVPEYTFEDNYLIYGIPEKRSPDQKYVMVSIESSHYYPLCNTVHNNFFNWTWTYKLDSDVLWNYFGITDLESGRIIGPRIDMKWRKDMEDLSIEEKKKLSGRSKAVAWLVSNCNSKSKREDYVKRLIESLKKYNLQVDIYGRCGSRWNGSESDFFNYIKTDYYFYMSFENSFAEDYATEKLGNPLKYGIVPIVWGLGNYARFAPPGSYIDARKIMNTDELADKINHLMNNVDEYAEYFRWTKYYSYHNDRDAKDINGLCNLCAALNDPIKMAEHKSYSDIKKWWNGDSKNHC